MVSPLLGFRLLAVDPRLVGMDLWIPWQRRKRRARKQKKHLGAVEKIPRPGDGELRRSRQPETDGLPFAHGPQTQPPGLNIHALVPKARLRGVDRHAHRARDVETHILIAGRRVRHIHRLSVHRDGEGRRAHLCRHRRGLNAGGGMSDD